MPINFYRAFFGLSDEERQHLEFLVEDDEDFRNIITDSARLWRNHLRIRFPDPFQCRHAFLVRLLILGIKNSLNSGGGRQLGAAFALCVTDRVEQLVRRLDAQEANDVRCN